MITIPIYFGVVILASLLTFALVIWLQTRSSLPSPTTESKTTSKDKG